MTAWPAAAQEHVVTWADWASYGTAAVNPAIAAVTAIRSDHPKCKLGQLAISEGIGNALVLTMKHVIVSPRPCLGCAPDGMPSGHTMNSTIGAGSWAFGWTLPIGTGTLRYAAHRHTKNQVVAGLLVGGFAEWAGHALLRCD